MQLTTQPTSTTVWTNSGRLKLTQTWNFASVWKHNVSYCVHSPSLDSIISQFNQLQSRPYSFNIHVYILLHYMLSLTLRFSGYYNILYIPFIFSHACYMPKHPNYSVGYLLSSTFQRYKSVYLSQLPLSHTHQLLEGQVSHPYFFRLLFCKYFSSVTCRKPNDSMVKSISTFSNYYFACI
jgi:hypothetical protein